MRVHEDRVAGAGHCWSLAGVVAVALFLAASGSVPRAFDSHDVTEADSQALTRELEEADREEPKRPTKPRLNHKATTTGPVAEASPTTPVSFTPKK